MLGLEVSRLARSNADWYRLLDLAGMTDTLIADADGIYHPASFNDRLVLGLKGTMSEAELHVLRARLEGGIRNKAARGELRRGLPVGLVWGDEDGEILLHPDEAVRGVMNPGPNSGSSSVEVVDPDTPLGLVQLEPDPAACVPCVLGGVEHPLKLLRHNDRHTPNRPARSAASRYGRTWASLRSSHRLRSGSSTPTAGSASSRRTL